MEPYTGPERRQDVQSEMIRRVVKQAVDEALRGANLIDGPTHIAHHQAIEELLEMLTHAKKSIVGGLVKGLLVLLGLGLLAWIWGRGVKV